MTSDIWSGGAIARLVGRYVSYTGWSGKLQYDGVLIAVEYVTKTLTLATKSGDSSTGNKAHTTDRYGQRVVIQTVKWGQGDDIKVVDRASSDDTLCEINTRKISITKGIRDRRNGSLEFTDNLLQLLVQPKSKSLRSSPCASSSSLEGKEARSSCELEYDTTTIT